MPEHFLYLDQCLMQMLNQYEPCHLQITYILDRETKEKMKSLSNQCLNQLDSMHADHDKSLTTIQNQMEVCLIKDYKVHLLML